MRPIRKLLPVPVRDLINRLYAACFRKMVFPLMDLADRLIEPPDDLTPPRRMVYSSGNGIFIRRIREHGRSTIRFIADTVGLRRNERILEVGCGVGVKTIPLAEYMAGEGTHEGLDIVPEQIAWLQQHVTPRFPNCRFLHANIYNKWYNPSGDTKASEYVFPYENESFDFVFLISVFTHMLPEDMEHYLSEITRVLKVGGRSFITYFLLNAESLPMARKGINGPEFNYEMDGYWTSNAKIPEDAVAYKEDYIRSLYDRFGLLIKDPPVYGSWYGREGAGFYQDVIVGWKSKG